MWRGKNFQPMKSNREHCDHLERSSLKYVHLIQLHKYQPPNQTLTLSIIALCLYNHINNEGGRFSQNCLETELNQFCLKYNKQKFKALGGGGGGDSLIKLVLGECKISTGQNFLGKT